jgi:hypothetical protein
MMVKSRLEKIFLKFLYAQGLWGRPQRTSALFRGGGGTQLQTFADFRGEESQECRRLHLKKNNQDTFPIKNVLQFVLLRKIYTLAAEMFGVDHFWLEIRVIIKILFHP